MKIPGRRRFVASLGATSVALAGPALLRAQGKPLTIVLTVPPGTSSDTLARMLGERLRARLNRMVVVESKSGAGGTRKCGYWPPARLLATYAETLPSFVSTSYSLNCRKASSLRAQSDIVIGISRAA